MDLMEMPFLPKGRPPSANIIRDEECIKPTDQLPLFHYHPRFPHSYILFPVEHAVCNMPGSQASEATFAVSKKCNLCLSNRGGPVCICIVGPGPIGVRTRSVELRRQLVVPAVRGQPSCS